MFFQIVGIPKASTIIMVKRIRVSAETPNDNRLQVRGYIATSTATGLVATTASPKNTLWRADGASVQVKNLTTSTAFGGFTAVATLFQHDFNARGVWEFIARDEQDYFVTQPSTWFGLSLLSTSASVTANVTVEWIS